MLPSGAVAPTEPINISVDYTGVAIPSGKTIYDLRIYHGKTVNNVLQWVPVTVSRNDGEKKLVAEVSSLSPFAVGFSTLPLPVCDAAQNSICQSGYVPRCNSLLDSVGCSDGYSRCDYLDENFNVTFTGNAICKPAQ